MKIVLSPAKRLNESPIDQTLIPETTPLLFPDAIQPLLDIMKNQPEEALKKMMKLSDKLAALNVLRFQNLRVPIPENQGKPAIFLFNGDAYQGLDAASLMGADLVFAQQNLRLLSGLYGVLRPMDSIMPYRLEMGTKLKGPGFENLYQYWSERITAYFQELLKQDQVPALINLASQEYFTAIRTEELDAPVYNMHFKEYRDGKYKFLSYYGKKARGLLARFIIKNQLFHPEEIKHFDLEGYHFNTALSTEYDWVFSRGG